LEKAIADVDVLDFASPEWGPTFDRLLQLVQSHVEQEENDFFPQAQQLIDEDESKQILERYEAAKKSVKKHVQ
jgi:hemerythrin-like domain-containing protein